MCKKPVSSFKNDLWLLFSIKFGVWLSAARFGRESMLPLLLVLIVGLAAHTPADAQGEQGGYKDAYEKKESTSYEKKESVYEKTDSGYKADSGYDKKDEDRLHPAMDGSSYAGVFP